MGFFAEIIASGTRSAPAAAPARPFPAAAVPEPFPSAAEAPPAQPVPATEASMPPAMPVAAAAPAPQESAPLPPTAPEPPPEQPMPEPVPSPAEAKQEPVAAAGPPTVDLTPAADDEDEAARKHRRAYEAAEAKRKAEWEAKQSAKKKARQEQLDRIKAMNDAELLAASAERVAADTERLTRRNMREAVAGHIQAKCREDAAFARLVMDPDKSMINCFKYINRQAQAFAEQEMADLGIKRAGTYGCDVPDGLCYQWGEDYFRDPDAKEDHENDEIYVPKPYVSPARKTSKAAPAKKKPEKKEPAAGKPKGAVPEQMSLI